MPSRDLEEVNKSKELTIRQAGLSDLDAIAKIEEDSFDEPWSPDEIKKDLSNSGGSIFVAIAEIGDEKAGYADIRIIKGEAEIYHIATAPAYRRQGVGEALLEHLAEKCKEQDCHVLRLEVRAGNEAALKLYTKAGFKVVGRRKGYYENGSEDAILMDKDL